MNRQRGWVGPLSRCVVVTAILGWTSGAMAAKAERRSPRRSDAASEGHKNRRSADVGAHSDSSRANREGKNFMVVVDSALVNLLHFGTGIEGGYYLDANSLIEIGYMNASFEFLGFKSQHMLLTAEYHRFVGNSFYLFGGTGIRTVTAASDRESIGGTLFDTYSSNLSATSVIAQGGLGNRWQFSTLTIGCDWVAYALPLFKLSSSSSYGETATAEDKARDQSDFDKTANGGVLTAVRFHIGASF